MKNVRILSEQILDDIVEIFDIDNGNFELEHLYVYFKVEATSSVGESKNFTITYLDGETDETCDLCESGEFVEFMTDNDCFENWVFDEMTKRFYEIQESVLEKLLKETE